MDTKTLAEMFEDEKFRKHSFCFYKNHITKVEAASKSGISRGKVTPDVEKVGNFDKDYIDWDIVGQKGEPLKFKDELVVDWLSEIGGLDEEEVKFLEKVISSEKVKSEILQNSDSWMDFFLNLAQSWKINLWTEEKGISDAVKNSLIQVADEGDLDDIERNTSIAFATLEIVRENQDAAERVYEKLKTCDFPLEVNPFAATENIIDPLSSLLTDLSSKFLTEENMNLLEKFLPGDSADSEKPQDEEGD